MLNAVVLPDPFGPMRAVMVPSCTSNEQASTAVTPPKDFFRWSISRSALLIA
jgi:hypothetical protein